MNEVFWISATILLYVYVGYPALIWVLARVFGREPGEAVMTPWVTLLIPAYNEEAHIEAKLENALELDYPKGRLDIVVASDGSTDRTDEIARGFADRGVTLIRMPENAGKAAMLSSVIPRLSGEIVVLSDASGLLEREALSLLMRKFSDPKVGCVSGLYRVAGRMDLRDAGEGLYWKYETFIKRQESRLHSILGAHGALYAIRGELFPRLESWEVNDDYLIPMRIVHRGFRAVYEPRAVCWERETVSVQGEYARRRRIAVGNCQQMAEIAGLLHPARWWVLFEFLSHKVLRTLAPLFMLALLPASLWLEEPWNLIVFGAQAAFYAAALAGYGLQRFGVSVKLLSAPMYFCLGNLAMLAGVIRYCRGPRGAVWGRVR